MLQNETFHNSVEYIIKNLTDSSIRRNTEALCKLRDDRVISIPKPLTNVHIYQISTFLILRLHYNYAHLQILNNVNFNQFPTLHTFTL